MKVTTVLVFILALFSQDTMAFTFADRIPFRQICGNIDEAFKASPTSEICNEVISQYEGIPPFVFSTCEDVISKYRSHPTEGKDYCISLMKDISIEETPSLLITTSQNLKQRGPTQVQQSMAMEQCEESSINDFTCQLNNEIFSKNLFGIISPIVLFPVSVPVAQQSFTTPECTCLESSVKRMHKVTSIMNLETSLKMERKRINDLIFNAAGKKIINNFATNLEDVNFYLTNNVTAIGGNKNSGSLQCNDFAAIKSKVDEKCGQTGVPSNVRSERMARLLNAFGDLDTENSPAKMFSKLQQNIMNYKLDPSRVFPGRSDTFTRQDYDRFRFGVYKTQPQVTFINDITDRILDDEILGKRLIQGLEEGEKPGEVLFKILNDKSNPDNRRILTQFLKSKPDNSFYDNLRFILSTNSTDDLRTFLIQNFDVATDMHPSLKALMKDTNLFLSTRERMHLSGNHSLIENLDSSQSALSDYYREKCEKIKNDFATAVCVPDDNFLPLTNREDLNQLLAGVHDQINPALKDLLLCRMDSTPLPTSIFSKLSFDLADRLNIADYYLMKVNPKENAASRFSHIANEFQGGDEKTHRKLSRIVSSGDEFRVSASDEEETMIPLTEASEETSLLDTLAQSSIVTPENRVNEAPVNNYIAPVSPQEPATPAPPESNVDPKSMLRDFLANKENEEEVNQLLDQTSSKDHEELLRLRRELATNKAKLAELSHENEQRKLAVLQENYEALEKEIAEMPAESARHREASPVVQTSGGEEASASISEAPGPVRNFDSSSSSPSAVTGGSSTSGQSGAGGVSRAVASENSSGEASSVNISAGAIVIDAGTIQGKIPTAREDINEKIITFLQETRPDIATLRQLKTSGIILKFRVLENGEEVVKEMKVEYALLSPEARQLLERKITQQEKSLALNAARRAYSFSALKHLLGIEARSQN